MSNTAVTFTGDNIDELTALGVHVIPHPTQPPAQVVFPASGSLDPIGTLQPGQQLVHGANGYLIVGAASLAAHRPVETHGLFNPSKANVDEVLEYLTNCDDEAEKERVIAAERAGKARKSIVGEHVDPDDAGDQDQTPDQDPPASSTTQTDLDQQ